MNTEIDETKKGKIILTCGVCGTIHTITEDSIGELQVKSKFVRPEKEEIEKIEIKPGDNKPGDNKPGDDKLGDDKPGEKSFFERLRERQKA
jgi:hypothetical protein